MAELQAVTEYSNSYVNNEVCCYFQIEHGQNIEVACRDGEIVEFKSQPRLNLLPKREQYTVKLTTMVVYWMVYEDATKDLRGQSL